MKDEKAAKEKAEQRLIMIAPLLDPGLDKEEFYQKRLEISYDFSVSTRTIQRYIDAYNEAGIDGLKPKGKVPENNPVVSKEILEEHLQKSVDYYAYPFGQEKDFGCATPELLQEIGFKAAFTTLWKLNNLHENPYRLRRVEIKPTDSMEDFQRYLNPKVDLRFVKQEIKSLLR